MRPWCPLLIALTVLAAACETSGPRPPVAVNHVPTSATTAPTPSTAPSAPASPAPTATPTATAAGPARCHTGGLLFGFAGSQGAAGTIVDTFRVANTGQAACTLYGFVGMLMLGSAGQPMPTRVVRSGGIFETEAGPSQFLLQPATAASFRAAWSDVPHANDPPGACAQAAQLEITPPDEFDHAIIPVSNWNLAPCNAGVTQSANIIDAPGAQLRRVLSEKILFKMAGVIHGADNVNPLGKEFHFLPGTDSCAVPAVCAVNID